MVLGRREAWPALIILGVGLLILGVVLKSAQADMPLEPPWVLAVLVFLYAVLAVAAGGFTWRAAVVFGTSLLVHLTMALLMGWGYSAVEGHARGPYLAAQHGLWDYLPGTALQFGLACIAGIVTEAWLERERAQPLKPVELDTIAPELPDLAATDDPHTAVTQSVTVTGVSGALLAWDTPIAAGVWERDPEGALQRVQAIASWTGKGLNTLSLEHVNLLMRSEPGRLAALLVDDALDRRLAHELLRDLWAVGERAFAEAPGEA